VLNELIHYRKWLNQHLFHADWLSVFVWPTLSFGRSRMTAPLGYWH